MRGAAGPPGPMVSAAWSYVTVSVFYRIVYQSTRGVILHRADRVSSLPTVLLSISVQDSDQCPGIVLTDATPVLYPRL